MAQMLGSRRTTVTMLARAMQVLFGFWWPKSTTKMKNSSPSVRAQNLSGRSRAGRQDRRRGQAQEHQL